MPDWTIASEGDPSFPGRSVMRERSAVAEDLPILELRGHRYSVVPTRVFEWHSRLMFDRYHPGLPDVPLAHRVLDMVAFPEQPGRAYRFTQFTLADALLERENLSEAEKAVFDAWFAQDRVQKVVANARDILTGFDPRRALEPFDLNLYSHLRHFLLNCRLGRAKAEQWRRTLENACAHGVSRTELLWSGLPVFLSQRADRIHRDELLAALDLGAVRLRVFKEVRCMDCPNRSDGTLDGDGELAPWVYADDVRLWPRALSNIEFDGEYEEWHILAEDDVVDVVELHAGGQRNAIAHLRTTTRLDMGGERLLCIDEAQAIWSARLRGDAEGAIPDTPYRQRWLDAVARVALLIAARKYVSRIAWVSGRIAQELHLDGPAPQLGLIYDGWLPLALRQALRGTPAVFGHTRVPTWSRDWQVRRQDDDRFVLYHDGQPSGESYSTWSDARDALAQRAQPVEEMLACVEIDTALQERLLVAGLPWLGAPDWTREYRNGNNWHRDRDDDLFPRPHRPDRPLYSSTNYRGTFDIEVHLRWGNNTAYVIDWDLYIDGVEIHQTIDPVALASSAAKAGDFFLFTCSCGYAGCAGINEPVLVFHSPEQIRWDFIDPPLLEVEAGAWQTLLFNAKSYRETIARALARTQALLTHYPEAGTGLGGDLWRDVPSIDCFPTETPSALRLPAGVRRIEIGWFWTLPSTDKEESFGGDYDLKVDGQHSWIPELFPVRSVREVWQAWRDLFWRDDEENDLPGHLPRRDGDLIQINRRGRRLARALAQVVPETVTVWYYPVEHHPTGPEDKLRQPYCRPGRLKMAVIPK